MSEDVTKEISEKAPEFLADLSNELYRTYEFPGGSKITINYPMKLSVKRHANGDSHRIVDAQEISHYIPVGWIHLFWKGKNGVAFTF